MKKSIGLVIMVASMFAASSALAQEGKMEVSVAGNMTATTTDTGFGTSDSTSTFLYLRLGQYLSPQLVVSGNIAMFGNDDGSSSSVGTNFGLGAKYYVGESAKSQFVPFVEADVHAVVITSTTTTTTYTMTGGGMSMGVGGSFFITEDVSADISVQGFADALSDDYGAEITQSGVRFLFGLTARY